MCQPSAKQRAVGPPAIMSDAQSTVLHCVICAEPAQAFAVGPCNHKEVCALCHLRMRMCYGVMRCPLCKADVSKVVITPVRWGRLPDWARFSRCGKMLPELWHQPRWNLGVYIDNAPPWGAPAPERPLSREMVGRTGLACPVCDPSGRRVFRSLSLLTRHLDLEHQRALCKMCVEARRYFVVELDAHTPPALAQHAAAVHPQCRFCHMPFFDQDALFAHVRAAHFTCPLCQDADTAPVFAHMQHLTGHLRREHHLCEEPECRESLIAFRTREELAMHRRERHSAAMPRFDRSRARPLPLDQPAFALPLPSLPSQRRRPGPEAGQLHGTHPTGRRLQGPVARTPPQPGLVMIDDDRGLAAEAGMDGASRTGRDPAPDEPFPTLAAAAAAAPAQQEARRAAPALASALVCCGCGRRSTRVAVVEGASPPERPLACTAECAAAARRAQLADAFDVGTMRTRPGWDRMRTASYTPEMLLRARAAPSEVAALERVLAGFLADPAAHHAALPPAPAPARALQHQLAVRYGLGSHSTGTAPRRAVQLFKIDGAAIPSNLLSEAARALPQDKVEQLARAVEGHPLHFSQVAPGTDLGAILSWWAGSLTLEGPRPDGTAVARFTSPQALKEASDFLGGGIRGMLRVNRQAEA